MIDCRAINERSLYITAKGDVIPCCWMYRHGPNNEQPWTQTADDKNFKQLTDTWTTDSPYHLCKITCDNTDQSDPRNLIHFDRQRKK